MEKKFYCCDGGTIAIDCKGSIIRFNNGYGDGCFKCYDMTEAEFKVYIENHTQYDISVNDYYFITRCYFNNAYVMGYDFPDELTPVLFVLNGEYDIYSLDGKIYFIKIKDGIRK